MLANESKWQILRAKDQEVISHKTLRKSSKTSYLIVETETKERSVKTSFWKISCQKASFSASQLLTPLCSQNLDADSKFVVGFSVRLFLREI